MLKNDFLTKAAVLEKELIILEISFLHLTAAKFESKEPLLLPGGGVKLEICVGWSLPIIKSEAFYPLSDCKTFFSLIKESQSTKRKKL